MTYPIVARDPASGELGVAVHSHFFGVEMLVPWAQAGVRAVATQSIAEPAYGSRGPALMRDGASAPEALQRLLAEDPLEHGRQVAMIDRAGPVAVHTGARCIRHAGHAVGNQVSAQANIMARDTVPDAMAHAFAAAPDPLAELSRLLSLQGAYARVDRGDQLAATGDTDGARREYEAAHRDQRDNAELAIWHGVALAANGRVEEARSILACVFARHSGWAELLRRLPEAGLLPADERLIARLKGTRSESI